MRQEQLQSAFHKNILKSFQLFIFLACIFLFNIPVHSMEIQEIETYYISSEVIKSLSYKGYVFVVNGEQGLKIFKESDRKFESPVEEVDGPAYDMEIYQDHLVLASDYEGVSIFKINFTNTGIFLTNIYHFTEPGFLFLIKIFGQTLFIADRTGTFYFLDLSDIQEPDLLYGGLLKNLQVPTSIEVIGNQLLVGDENQGLLHYDISNIRKPVFKQKISPGNELGITQIYYAKDKKLVFLGTLDGIYVSSYKSDSEFSFEHKIPLFLNGINDIIYRDDKLYILGDLHFLILDVKNLKAPKTLVSKGLMCSTLDLNIINKNEILVSTFCQGLKRIRLKND